MPRRNEGPYSNDDPPPVRRAVILAAGKGNRLQPLTADVPKCLVEVGGKPLLDTRQHIYNTLNGTRTRQGNTVLYTLRGSLAAVFHHNGFKTKGPNFIPLTLHARRTHRKGNDPRLEGLVKDVDYIMAWKGVDVPARPIFRIAPEDRRQIIRTIQVALRRRTSRRAA